jgi:Holliday junction resolvasome RuvABC endonuclease subunit
MSNILAIDPGMGATGWAVNTDPIQSGVLKFKPIGKRPNSYRAWDIYYEIVNILDSYAISEAIVEIPGAFGYSRHTSRSGKSKNVKSLLILSQCVGIVDAACGVFSVPTAHIEAHTWKHGMSKEVAIQTATGIAGRPIEDHNEADAICLLNWYVRQGGKQYIEQLRQ